MGELIDRARASRAARRGTVEQDGQSLIEKARAAREARRSGTAESPAVIEPSTTTLPGLAQSFNAGFGIPGSRVGSSISDRMSFRTGQAGQFAGGSLLAARFAPQIASQLARIPKIGETAAGIMTTIGDTFRRNPTRFGAQEAAAAPGVAAGQTIAEETFGEDSLLSESLLGLAGGFGGAAAVRPTEELLKGGGRALAQMGRTAFNLKTGVPGGAGLVQRKLKDLKKFEEREVGQMFVRELESESGKDAAALVPKKPREGSDPQEFFSDTLSSARRDVEVALRDAESSVRRVEEVEALGDVPTLKKSAEVGFEKLSAAEKIANDRQKILFGLADLKTPIPSAGVKRGLDRLQAETTEGDLVPNVPPEIVRVVRALGESPPLEALQNLRSGLLAKVRSGELNPTQESAVSRLSDDVLTAMDAKATTLIREGRQNGQFLRKALVYTRELKETFERGVGGAILKAGGKVEQETAFIRKAPLTGPEGLDSVRQIKRAQKLAQSRDPEAPDLIEPLQTRFMAELVELPTNPATGLPEEKALGKFLSERRMALSELPELSAQIGTVRKAQQRLELMQRLRTGLRENIDESGVSNFIKADDAVIAIGNALKGDASDAPFARLWRQTGGNKKARQGFRDAFRLHMENTFVKPGKIDGDGMSKFIDRHHKKVRLLYGDDGVSRLRTVSRMLGQGLDIRKPIGNIIRVRQTVGAILGAKFGRSLNTGTIQTPGRTAAAFERVAQASIGKSGVDPNKALFDAMFERDVFFGFIRAAGKGPEALGRAIRGYYVAPFGQSVREDPERVDRSAGAEDVSSEAIAAVRG